MLIGGLGAVKWREGAVGVEPDLRKSDICLRWDEIIFIVVILCTHTYTPNGALSLIVKNKQIQLRERASYSHCAR